MSEPADPPAPYHVAYSDLVRAGLTQVASTAKARGTAARVLAALKEMDRRLHIYPQFGEPLRDLPLSGFRLWIATFPPFVVRYLIHEESRRVCVVNPIATLPRSGL